MTRLLLDFPWTLEAGLGPDPTPQNAIRDFLNLLARTGLDATRFIEPEECNVFSSALEGRAGRGRFDLVMRFLHHCTRHAGSPCQATPVPEPLMLRDSWKRGPLRVPAARLVEERSQGWRLEGGDYFIPPAAWRPEQIAKSDWRGGYAFERETVPGWRGPCPIDYNGRTWRWDNERHWDVQLE